MAISFSAGGICTLYPTDLQSVDKDVFALLVTGEECAAAFRNPREQVIFTNKRIIAADMQGLSGKRKSYATLPYGKVNFFSVQTTGSIGDASDSELTLSFCNGADVTFRVIGNTDFGKLSRRIAEYIL